MGETKEYTSEAELLNEFRSYMRDPKNVDIATDYLYNSLIDEMILGVTFEIHHEVKTGVMNAMEGKLEDNGKYQLIDLPDVDVFGSANIKKAIDCTCPNCDRLVAASRFAPHLEKCMGMGRASHRMASRRIANSREGNNFYASSIAISDDEDDADWSGEKKKKKLTPVRTNGSKKNGKT